MSFREVIAGQLKPHVVLPVITFNSRANDKRRRNIIKRPEFCNENMIFDQDKCAVQDLKRYPEHWITECIL